MPTAGDDANRADERDKRRQAMQAAAVELVRRDGPMVSMEQIAAECGVTKPIIYRHFGDRDGLLMEMAERFVDELVDEVSPALFRDDAAPIELLTATMDAYLGLIERDTNLYRFLSTHAGTDRRDLFASMVAEQIAVVVERRLAERGLDTAPARAWAYGLVGMVQFAGDWWISEPSAPRGDVVRQLTTLLWVGFDRLGLGDAPPAPRSAELERALDLVEAKPRAKPKTPPKPRRTRSNR
ncbi:MAG: TetR/AcrR family transcriptional regulator [Actinobacteria bacterium]|nr:TetR/AcrR family transcriptional regulator [Actinomycetota bacterium]